MKPCQASDRSGGGHCDRAQRRLGVVGSAELRPLDPIVTEVPLVLRYDRKQGESKMRVGSTVWRSLGLAVRRRLGRMD